MTDKLPPKIIVAEPNDSMNTTLCNMIERYWFDVIRAKNSEMATRLAAIHLPNLAVISSRVSDKNAIDVLKEMRAINECKDIPVIFLIEATENVDEYKAAGEPYCEVLQRTFSPNELMTSIRSLLRRSSPVLQDKIIGYDDIKMDLSTFKVYRGDKQVHLGPTEFKMLQLFVTKPRNVYSRQQIIDYVWGNDDGISLRTIDVHINRLRRLMKLESDRYPIIKTIRAAGYCLD